MIDTASQLVHKYIGVAIHSLKSEDRLGNPLCTFPIGVAVGDRDHVTTEGSEDVLEMLKERVSEDEAKKYRLFVIPNASHALVWGQPEMVSRTVIAHL